MSIYDQSWASEGTIIKSRTKSFLDDLGLYGITWNSIKQVIEKSFRNICKRLLIVNPKDRYSLLCEYFECLCCDWEDDDVLLVPKNLSNLKEKSNYN